jgi:hypothetical protein
MHACIHTYTHTDLHTQKELESKYTDEELEMLIDTGGITEVQHSKNSNVTMFIDHSNWEKTRTMEKKQEIGTIKQNKETDADELQMIEEGFHSFGLDFDSSEKFFLKDVRKDPDDDGKTSAAGKGLSDDMEPDMAYKACHKASMLASGKASMLQVEVNKVKSKKEYAAFRSKTNDFLEKLYNAERLQKKTFIDRRMGVKNVVANLKDLSELLKGVTAHISLLHKI